MEASIFGMFTTWNRQKKSALSLKVLILLEKIFFEVRMSLQCGLQLK
jgi:hypothetical protein